MIKSKKSKTYKENGVIITVCDPAYAEGYVPSENCVLPYIEPINIKRCDEGVYDDDN